MSDEHKDDCECQKCCEHGDVCTDERCCLICGKDMTEDLVAAAEYQADMIEDR